MRVMSPSHYVARQTTPLEQRRSRVLWAHNNALGNSSAEHGQSGSVLVASRGNFTNLTRPCDRSRGLLACGVCLLINRSDWAKRRAPLPRL